MAGTGSNQQPPEWATDAKGETTVKAAGSSNSIAELACEDRKEKNWTVHVRISSSCPLNGTIFALYCFCTLHYIFKLFCSFLNKHVDPELNNEQVKI